MEKTKDFNCNKNSTRGYLKQEYESLDIPNVKDKSDLNAKERKIYEMNPNFKIEEIRKIENENNNLRNSQKIKENDYSNKKPMNSRMNKVKGNSSNIFHSDVRNFKSL